MTESWKVWIRKWAQLIIAEGSITRLSLCERSGTSPWVLNKLEPYLMEMYPNIKYHKKHRVFYIESLEHTLSHSLQIKEKENEV